MKSKLNLWKLYIAISTIIVILFAFIAYHEYADIKHKYNVELTNINETTTRNIVSSFRYEESTLNILGKELLSIDAYNYPEKGRLLIEEIININKGLVAFGLAKYNGQLILVSTLPKGSKLPNLMHNEKSKESFKNVRDSSSMQLGRTYYMKALKQWVIPIRMGIKDKSGEIPLVMTAGIRTDGGDTALNLNELPKYIKIQIIRSEGYTQFQNPINKTEYKKVFTHKFDKKIFEIIKNLNYNKTHLIETIQNNKKYLSSALYIKEFDLYALVSMPTSKIYKEFEFHLLLTLFTLILILLTLYYIFKKNVTEQIKAEDIIKTYNQELERKVKIKTQEVYLKQKQFQDIVQTINDFIWEVDENAIYTYVSPQVEKILGYKPEEMIGLTPFDFMTEEESKIIKNTFFKIVKSKKSFSQLKNKNIHKDGSIIYFETSGVPIFDVNNNLLGYRGTDRNVTKRIQSEKKLEKSYLEIKELNNNLKSKINEEVIKNHKKDLQLFSQSKMAAMGEMLENIAHQWRQPLSVISTASSGIKIKNEMNMLEEGDIDSTMENISISVEHLSQTINDFRDFFKTNKKKNKFLITSTFKKTFKLTISQFKNANISIIKNIKEVYLFGFENELIHVLINIINNARDELIKKEQNAKLILIDTIVADQGLEIIIKDNAGGIPSDIIDNIFASHFTTKQDSNGTGIGLYMSKMIIEEHMNGTIEASNKEFIYENNSHVGAQFKICLPFLNEES